MKKLILLLTLTLTLAMMFGQTKVESYSYTMFVQNGDEINLTDYISDCDLLIGGVLVPGANAPKLISKEMISSISSEIKTFPTELL